MRIKFLATYTVAAADGPTYQAGSVHEVSEQSAQHFIRRGIAIEETAPPVVPPPPEPASVESVEAEPIARPEKRAKRK